MLCDELKVYVPQDGPWGLEPEEGGKLVEEETCYLKSDVDAAIDELKTEHHKERDEYISMVYSREQTIKELKKKLEDVQASAYAESVDAGMRERRRCRTVWLARAERYKIKEFIAREEGNLSNQMSWSRILRERTYNQWVDQLLRIANLANKLQNKCLAKAEEYK